jgi:hypothetical protein
MIPESAANRTIELYRATDFPDTWRLERVLMDDVYALDPTLLIQDGKFWLFVCLPERGAAHGDELSLFMSDTLDGPWLPHPANPVVSDVRSARPAGRLFVRDGSLIRPAQDASGGYGRAVVFNRVEIVAEAEYRETPMGGIGTEWLRGNRGTHTYNFDSRFEVVDGRRWLPRPRRTS